MLCPGFARNNRRVCGDSPARYGDGGKQLGLSDDRFRRARAAHCQRTQGAYFSDADRRAARAHPAPWPRAPGVERRGPHRSRRDHRPLLCGDGRPGPDCEAGRHNRDADCRPRPRRVHRRGEHDLGPPRALPRAGGRGQRGSRAHSRPPAEAGADRRRAQRDSDAGVPPAPRRADHRGNRRRRARRIDAFGRDAARQGVPDAQRPSLQVHRPRSRRRRPGAAGSISRRRRGCAGPDLPGPDGAAQSNERADRRLPRFQRGDRSDARARSRDCRRGAGRARRRRLRRIGGAGRAGGRIERPGRAGRIELAHRELPGLPHRHLRAGSGEPRLRPGAEVRRSSDHRQRRDATDLRPEAVRGRGRQWIAVCRPAP